MCERGIRLVLWAVVVAVVRSGEIGCAHGNADEAQADARLTSEKLLEQSFALCHAEPGLDEVGRCIGHRGAPSDNGLELPAVVNIDHRDPRVDSSAAEVEVWLSRE